MDNLDSQTYEIFEKDPIKYIQYEKVSIHVLFSVGSTCRTTGVYSILYTYVCGYCHSRTSFIRLDKFLNDRVKISLTIKKQACPLNARMCK